MLFKDLLFIKNTFQDKAWMNIWKYVRQSKLFFWKQCLSKFIRDCKNHYRYSLNMRGDPQNPQNVFIKDCVFIVTCLNFSHLPSTPFDAVHLSRHFFHCSKQFLNLLILMPLVLLLFFFVSLPLYLQNVFPWGIFFTKEKK